MKLKTVWLCFYCAALLLSGCATTAPPPSPPKPAVQLSEQQVVATLLAQAERDITLDRLMWPHGNNAHEKFLAVLQLQPENPQALSGMQQILIRYVELGRDALGENKLSNARVFLARAKRLDDSNPLVVELQESLALAESQQPLAGGVEYAIEPQDLSARADGVKQLLLKIARRVATTDESVLIVARNDNEGRWLYRELRNAAQGYRIRGDIRIESRPRILLLPPID